VPVDGEERRVGRFRRYRHNFFPVHDDPLEHLSHELALRTSIVTAYRWVFHPDDEGLAVVGLPVPAVSTERIAERVVGRLSDQDYRHPKVMHALGAPYFNSKIAPRLWKDESGPLDLEEASRRFSQWTYLPILPRRDETLRRCIREGLVHKLWALAVGDNETATYQELVETPDELDSVVVLFDGSASLVNGDLLQLIREQLGRPGPAEEAAPVTAAATPAKTEEASRGKPGIPTPARRLSRLTLRLDGLQIAKTSHLQPYLFKVLQEQDAATELRVTIEVSSDAGIPEDVIAKRIVEGLEQLGITVEWE
jgi:hypothetical protein